ncbi:MAG: hypothetical protein JJU31_08675 [Wenzhouxiangella sp.]|nr:hypothetical protein [Wenzhouxiangella sp.]
MELKDLSEIERLKFIGLKERICENRPWEATDTYKERIATLAVKGSVDGIDSEAKLKKRFESLDLLIQAVKNRGTLKTRQELDPRHFREKGGVPIMINRHGDLILGRGGTHRFFICCILGVPLMPFSLIAIHPEANREFGKIIERSRQLYLAFCERCH